MWEIIIKIKYNRVLQNHYLGTKIHVPRNTPRQDSLHMQTPHIAVEILSTEILHNIVATTLQVKEISL